MRKRYRVPVNTDPSTLPLVFDNQRNIYVDGEYFTLDGEWPGGEEHPIDIINTPSVIDYESELDAFINSKAQERNWDNRITCAMRAGYPNPWQAEATAFAQWMDSCYQKAFEIQEAVVLGQRSTPSLQEFLQEMPVFNWS